MARLEIAVDSVKDGVLAAAVGADRLEVCADLSAGGITPPEDLFGDLRRRTDIPLFVMIRPRAGDFCFTSSEAEEMLRRIGFFRTHGADGFVVGGLMKDRTPDLTLMRRLTEAAGDLPCTFHRAFDQVSDQMSTLDALIDCGVTRLLTSGGAATAEEGKERLRTFVEHVRNELIVLPGGGVRPENAEHILRVAGVKEIHSSARSATGTFDATIAGMLAGIVHASDV